MTVMGKLRFVLAALLLLCCATGRAAVGRDVANALQHRIDSLVVGKKMDIGIAVEYGGNMLCRVNAGRRFPMMSVYKLHQAVAIMDSLKCDSKALEEKVWITEPMLRKDTYSPLRDEYPDGDVCLFTGALLQYSLGMSDNNACDILFGMFGGTDYVNDRMRELGLSDTQIKWNEEEMHSDTARCRDNFTTPDDAVRLLNRAFGCDWLRDALTGCKTGTGRLPARLPEGTVVGHKTGTGDTTPDSNLHGINDIGFVFLPDGTHYNIAVFCDNARMTLQEAEVVIAEVSRLVYDGLTASYDTSHDR